MRQDASLFEAARLNMHDSIKLTIESLESYGPRFKHWAATWSMGKDSTVLVALMVHLMDIGRIPRPETFTVLSADTRVELPNLYVAAQSFREDLEERGIDVRIAMAPLDERFLVYMLGRGVPPPNSVKLRWCTRLTKIKPMAELLALLFAQRKEKVLLLTGLRLGESAARDARIAIACNKDGGECGQGWFQATLPSSLCDRLAPILHWRTCHVFKYLRDWAPTAEFGDFSTRDIVEAYGGDAAEEEEARFGCIECPLVEEDTALALTIKRPQWAYLAPLQRLRGVYRRLREDDSFRLRQPGGERRKDGKLALNQQRKGPLIMEARRWALGEVLAIQRDVNAAALQLGRPTIDILNGEEEARIRELVAANTWPEKWTGEEPTADVLLDKHFSDGSVQPLLEGLFK